MSRAQIPQTRPVEFTLDGKRVRATVRMAIDYDELVRRFGHRAAVNKGRRAQLISGAIVMEAFDVEIAQ